MEGIIPEGDDYLLAEDRYLNRKYDEIMGYDVPKEKPDELSKEREEEKSGERTKKTASKSKQKKQSRAKKPKTEWGFDEYRNKILERLQDLTSMCRKYVRYVNDHEGKTLTISDEWIQKKREHHKCHS